MMSQECHSVLYLHRSTALKEKGAAADCQSRRVVLEDLYGCNAA